MVLAVHSSRLRLHLFYPHATRTLRYQDYYERNAEVLSLEMYYTIFLHYSSLSRNLPAGHSISMTVASLSKPCKKNSECHTSNRASVAAITSEPDLTVLLLRSSFQLQKETMVRASQIGEYGWLSNNSKPESCIFLKCLTYGVCWCTFLLKQNTTYQRLCFKASRNLFNRNMQYSVLMGQHFPSSFKNTAQKLYC